MPLTLQAIAATFKHAGVCDDFLSLVEDEMVIDPAEWRQRYAIEHGAVFGLSHGLSQLALFRPAVKDPQVHSSGVQMPCMTVQYVCWYARHDG